MSDEVAKLVDAGATLAEGLEPVKDFYEKNPMAKVAINAIAKPIINKLLEGDIEGAIKLYDETNKAGSMKSARDMIRSQREDGAEWNDVTKRVASFVTIIIEGAILGLI